MAQVDQVLHPVWGNFLEVSQVLEVPALEPQLLQVSELCRLCSQVDLCPSMVLSHMVEPWVTEVPMRCLTLWRRPQATTKRVKWLKLTLILNLNQLQRHLKKMTIKYHLNHLFQLILVSEARMRESLFEQQREMI